MISCRSRSMIIDCGLLAATRSKTTSLFTYMREMEKRRQTGADMGYFDDWQMKMLLLDLFFAGMETTVTTLKWGFLLATIHPEVQRKVQEELDNKCAGTIVTLADRPRLPYTQAVINTQ
ncbi:hypothetical protein OESDEN_10116 [Oesophagostomum dentatum]|uniref:Unspecific monooxygenase n=1 Tax=Oesophagostomum dentatum TaxID=61180 RepID=A0A0B1T2N6_OESDE|nr:hypothetical protein OESDEN_10116 [Oesophagostomum dentatum]